MTRDEAVAFVKHLLHEESSTQALASEPNLALTISLANTKIWLDAVEAHAGFWTVASPAVTVQNGEAPLSAFDPVGVHLVRHVQIQYGSAWLGVQSIAPRDGGDTEPVAGAYVDEADATAYYIEGESLYLYPKTDGPTTARLKYVPRLPVLNAGSQLLGGRLPEFHAIVCYDAAIELAAKDEAATKEWARRRDELGARLPRYMRSRTRGGSPYIRVVDA